MGCNYYKGAFLANPQTGEFALTQDLAGADLFCTSDEDLRVANAFRVSSLFTYDGISLIFYTSDRVAVLSLKISLGDVYTTSGSSTTVTTTSGSSGSSGSL